LEEDKKKVEKEGRKDAVYIYNLRKRNTVVTVDTLNVTGLNSLKIEKRKTNVTLLCVQCSSTSESTLLFKGFHVASDCPSSTRSIDLN
jgi:hypothetical protein